MALILGGDADCPFDVEGAAHLYMSDCIGRHLPRSLDTEFFGAAIFDPTFWSLWDDDNHCTSRETQHPKISPPLPLNQIPVLSDSPHSSDTPSDSELSGAEPFTGVLNAHIPSSHALPNSSIPFHFNPPPYTFVSEDKENNAGLPSLALSVRLAKYQPGPGKEQFLMSTIPEDLKRKYPDVPTSAFYFVGKKFTGCDCPVVGCGKKFTSERTIKPHGERRHAIRGMAGYIQINDHAPMKSGSFKKHVMKGDVLEIACPYCQDPHSRKDNFNMARHFLTCRELNKIMEEEQ